MKISRVPHEITATVVEEAGYMPAMEGLSYNMNQPLENMPALAEKLAFKDGGHNKFLESIQLWIRTRAPRYWWQEGDTYRHSTKQSQSTMHTILKNKLDACHFELHDISHNYLNELNTILAVNNLVKLKRRLPEGFMQTRMWHFNYKTMRNIILQRRKHRLPHWQTFIASVLEQVKYPELLPALDPERWPCQDEK